jgi:hypothetical protein
VNGERITVPCKGIYQLPWHTTCGHILVLPATQGFIEEYGAEMFLEICRFWASKTVYNEQTGRYEIHKVMGPDEFHEKLPGE